MKTTVKKSLVFILMLSMTLSLTLAACSFITDLIPSGGGIPSASPDGDTQSGAGTSGITAPDVPAPDGGNHQITLINDTGDVIIFIGITLEFGNYDTSVHKNHEPNDEFGRVHIVPGGNLTIDMVEATNTESYLTIWSDSTGSEAKISLPKGIPAGATVTLHEDLSCTVESDEGTVRTDSFAMVYAKGFDEGETVLRITVPNLQSDVRRISIQYGDAYLGINVDEYVERSPHNVYRFPDPSISHARGYIDGNDITVSFYEPEESAHDWDDADEFRMLIQGDGTESEQYIKKADIEEVPLSQILPDITDMRELRNDRSAAEATLKAVDNGDGTMTFTYTDPTMRPVYIYPWGWDDIRDGWDDIKNQLTLHFNLWITGRMFPEYPGDAEVAIGSYYDFYRREIYAHDWNYAILNMTDALTGYDLLSAYGSSDPNKIPFDTVEINENGMKLTWTLKFFDGYSLDDVDFFRVDLLASGMKPFLLDSDYEDWQYIGFEVEEVMG